MRSRQRRLRFTYSPRMWNVYSPSPSPGSRRWLDRRTALLGGTIAVLIGTSLAGVASLADHVRSQDGSPLRAPSGLALILLAVAQARILFPLATIRPLLAQPHRVFWRGLLIGLIASYLLAAACFGRPGVEYVFAAVAAGWYTLGLASVRWADRMPRFDHLRTNRSAAVAGWLLFGAALLGTTVEIGLRLYGQLVDDRLPVAMAVRGRQLSPGSTLRGRTVNQLGYWGGDFHHENRHGRLRVAVLGDEVALSGTAAVNCFAQLERNLPGIEVYNFAIPEAGIREYSAQLRHQVLDYRPDLVLVLVSVGDDITEQLPTPDYFDIRGLRLYQLAALGLLAPGHASEPCGAGDARRRFLCRAERQLMVCKTPMNESARAQWSQAESHLNELIASCRQRGASPALVAVPTVYQVCAPLSAQLRRRSGFEAASLDIELPQRRLAAYAAGRRVPWIDLLPTLRELGGPAFEHSSMQLSAAGNQAVAEALEHWMLENFRQLVSPAAQASAR